MKKMRNAGIFAPIGFTIVANALVFFFFEMPQPDRSFISATPFRDIECNVSIIFFHVNGIAHYLGELFVPIVGPICCCAS